MVAQQHAGARRSAVASVQKRHQTWEHPRTVITIEDTLGICQGDFSVKEIDRNLSNHKISNHHFEFAEGIEGFNPEGKDSILLFALQDWISPSFENPWENPWENWAPSV